MVRFQVDEQLKKMPSLRRKLDRHHLEESAQLCALLTCLGDEVHSTYALAPGVWDSNVIGPFLDGDQNLVLALQGLLHTKPNKIIFEDLPLVGDVITAHVAKVDTALLSNKTELINADIMATEFKLFEQRLQADIAAVDSHNRRMRSVNLQYSVHPAGMGCMPAFVYVLYLCVSIVRCSGHGRAWLPDRSWFLLDASTVGGPINADQPLAT